MSNVNRFPEGFTAFMDLQARGQNPSALGELITPIIDMLGFYELGANPRVAQGATVVGILATSQSPVTVPQGQYWLVQQVTATHIVAAGGQASQVYCRLIRSGQPFGLAMADFGGNALSGLAGQQNYAIWQPPRPFWARPGDVFDTFLTQTNPGSSVTTAVLYTPFTS